MDKEKGMLSNIWNSFDRFYLGFLASIGLAFATVMIVNILRELLELYFKIDLLIYSRIFFSIFYIFSLFFTYNFLAMKNDKSLGKGFILFTVLYILGQIYIWMN